ncbi:hypothetical protein HYQ46_010198 [Verticillium longisporum]|nr:hypothetical protein HYQ46_010198 [Verticillium longisporum]
MRILFQARALTIWPELSAYTQPTLGKLLSRYGVYKQEALEPRLVPLPSKHLAPLRHPLSSGFFFLAISHFGGATKRFGPNLLNLFISSLLKKEKVLLTRQVLAALRPKRDAQGGLVKLCGAVRRGGLDSFLCFALADAGPGSQWCRWRACQWAVSGSHDHAGGLEHAHGWLTASNLVFDSSTYCSGPHVSICHLLSPSSSHDSNNNKKKSLLFST